MTLKLYFSNSAPSYTPGARAATFGWDRITGMVTRALGPRTGANTSVAQSKTSATANYDMLHGTWVSEPIVREMTITTSDTIGMTIGRQASTTATFVNMLCAWFTVGDSDTPRAVWRSATGSSQWGTGGGNAGWSHAGAGSSFTVFPGDRLVVEVGCRDLTTTTGRTATIWYGNGGGDDYVLGTNITGGLTTNVGNVELIGNPELLWTPLVEDPVDVIPFGNGSGLVHYAFDVGLPADGGRTLYYASTIAAGLNLDPEFTVITDGGISWVQAAARADATTTSGTTNNARSEGRETIPGADSNLGFDPTDGGPHWQRVRARVMEHPTASNVGIATGQLHSLQDDTVMVRTRMVSGVCKLVLRVYDPGTENSVDVLTLDEDYTFGDVYDILFLINGTYCYVFYQDFTRWVYRFPVSILPVTGTYMLKWGNYNQFYEGTAGVNATDWGRTHYRNVMHSHPGWAAPTNYPGVPEVGLGSAASATVGTAFARTATESGTGITERRWAILDGPTGSGTEIGTAAALSWTPTTAGDYTLIYGAKNGEGWSNPTFLQVTASTPSAGDPAQLRATTTGSGNTQAASYSITLPTRQVGDALIVAFANDEVGSAGSELENFADPDSASQGRGWSRLITEEQGGTTNHRFTIFYKAAAEGGTADNLTVTLVDPEEATWVAQSISSPGGAPTVQMDEGGNTSPVLGVPYTGLAPGPWLSLIYLGTDSSATTSQTASTPSGWTSRATVNPTVTSSAATFAWSREMPAGTTDIDAGEITLGTGEQWIRYHVIFPGSSAIAPTVGAGTDVTIDQYETLSRTATEDNGGATITARAWTVQSGPNQVGATIGTAAALSWAPTVGGTYVIRYTATNAAGSGVDEVTVTVDALVFPLTASLRLSATPAVAKHAEGPVSAPLKLTGDAAGTKQALAGPTATLHLAASMTGLRINHLQAFLRLSATIEASSNQGAFVTAPLRLSAGLADVSRDTPAVPVTAGPLELTADADTGSARELVDVDAQLVLDADIAGAKQVAAARSALLHLTAGIDDVAHGTSVTPTATLRLSASVSDRFHTGGRALTAPLRLSSSVATSSTRVHRILPIARLKLFGSAIGQRIIAAITAVTPRADTTVRYDLVAVARVPQAAGPPAFVEVDPIDWTDISWTEALGESPTLSASAKISTLTEPILQRLRTPHELPTELWAFRNGKAIFAGPLLGGRVNGDSIGLEAAGIETYLRWMHVVTDLQFTDTDQFSVVRALIDQWQGLEYGHFGIDSGSGAVGLLPDPVPGQATYQAANRTAENSDDDLSVARPSGTKAGDLLVAAHVCDTDGGLTAMTAPDGWSLAGETSGAADIPKLKIWTKTATANEPASYTFEQDDQDGALGILRIDGHNGTTPLAVTPVFASSATGSSSHAAPSVAGVQGGLLVTVHAADTAGSRRVYSQPPAGMEERVDIGANSALLGMFTQPLTAAGATGTRTAVCSASCDWAAASLVIAPAPPAQPPLVDNGPKSGVTRSVSYFASELHNVSDRIADLAKAADGFNMVIDPTTRRLELYHPGRGIDRSAGEDAIVFDARNLTSSDITFSIAPADLASDGFATGTTGGTDAPRTATYANLELRAKFGRTGVTSTFEVTDQASLDAYVTALVDARDQVLLIPGPSARVTLDADLGSYDVGDVVAYHAHGRLTTAGAFRIRKRTVRVAEANTETVAVEFV